MFNSGDSKMAVRYLEIPAREVFNLTSPRWLPDLSLNWHGRRNWHHPHYEPVRDMSESMYVDGMNRINGHYEKLSKSIQLEGFRNPVMLTTGRLIRRSVFELPLAIRKDRMKAICEYVGGSRLYLAAALAIKVPAIVNDFSNAFPHAEEIRHGDTKQLLRRFMDAPRKIIWRPDHVYCNFLPYTHFDLRERVEAEHYQRSIRQKVIRDILAATQTWLNEND